MDKLNRVLGFPLLTFYGTGMILGAGIYSVIGKAAGPAQDSLWLSFILAAIAAALTALSYAEMSTMFPKAGAEYVYLKKAFPGYRWLATCGGLLIAFAGAATASTVALAFSGYAQQFIALPAIVTAAVLLAVFTGVNIFGMRESSWINVLFTLIEIGGLLLFIYVGLQSDRFNAALSATPHSGTLSGAALIIFAYFGFENIVSLAEEAKRPERDIPLAIFISLILCTALYVLVSFAALALLSPQQLSASSAVMTEATQGYSPNAARVLGVIALFATANTALIALVTTSRIAYGMAEDRSLPKPLARVSGQRKTPWVSALVALVVAIALLPLGQVETVASVSAFTTMLCFIAVNVAVIYLRYSQPGLKRPFHIPFSLGRLPLFPVLAILFCSVLILQFESVVYGVGLGAVLVSLAFSYLTQNRGENLGKK